MMSRSVRSLSWGGVTTPRRPAPGSVRWATGARRTWLLLVAAAVLPLLLLGGWAGSLSAERTRANTRALARDTVALVAQRVTAELTAQLDLAQALAASTALDDGNLDAFRIEANRLEDLHPRWQAIMLSTPAGAEQVNLPQQGAKPPRPAADPSFWSVLQTRLPTVGGIEPTDTAPNARLVTLQVPVIRQGNLRYVLTVAMAPDAIGSILNQAGAPANWVGVVVDASGHILARTSAEDEPLGHLASPSLMDAIAHQAADFHISYTLKGLQVETVARVLPGTGGWTVAFGIPARTLQEPVRRALALLTAACLVSLALSAALAALVTRDMSQRREDERRRAELAMRRQAERDRLDLLRRLAQTQEDERRRISRDLHDQVGQTVTGLSLSLKALERDGDLSPARMQSLQAMVVSISRDIHQAAVALRPSVLDDLGLVRALQALAATSAEVSGLRIDVQAVGFESRLSSELETVIYRLVQEALTNILKHAGAHAVSILLDHASDQIRVIVEDDGIGFDVDGRTGRNDTSHLGLSSMRERLTLVRGEMTIESTPGAGTALFIVLPVVTKTEEAQS